MSKISIYESLGCVLNGTLFCRTLILNNSEIHCMIHVVGSYSIIICLLFTFSEHSLFITLFRDCGNIHIKK